MQVIEIQTLIDITDSGMIRPSQGNQVEQGQFRNFTTLKQCLELRSNIIYETSASVETRDVKEMGFGSKYKGKHTIWTFRFTPERSGAYEKNGHEVGCLYEDLHEVPIIKKLKETINIDKAVFDVTDSSSKNIIIKALQGTI
jgi:hypothetical protein